jgi:hypothetical protein
VRKVRDIKLTVEVDIRGSTERLVFSTNLGEGFNDREFKREGECLLDAAREELLKANVAEHVRLNRHFDDWMDLVVSKAVEDYGFSKQDAQASCDLWRRDLASFFVYGYTPAEALARYYTEPPGP